MANKDNKDINEIGLYFIHCVIRIVIYLQLNKHV